MCPKVKLFLYYFDFIGIVPQFRILKYDSYKTIFSSIISIIITISLLGFSIYSIIDYLKFENPSISYLKKYDYATNNTILLKDTLFMFKAKKIYNNNNEANLDLVGYYTSDFYKKNLGIESCQIGKNINIKFKDDLENKYNDKIDQFYCISSEHGDLPLFFYSGIIKQERSYLIIDIFDKDINDTCLDYYIDIELITENDIVAHDNIKNPILSSSYFYEGLFDCYEYFYIDYNFEFIKYETDDGYFFTNYKNITAIGMSEIYLLSDYISTSLGSIIFHLSEKNYPHYKRSYKKVQSLLADIMSIGNILVAVGKVLSNILLQKKMNKDIIRSLLNRNINDEIKEHSLIENNRRKKKLFNNINSRLTNSERKDKNKSINSTEISNIKNNSKELFNLSKDYSVFEENVKLNSRKKIIKAHILKKINFCDVIKSYFCFKSTKKSLINTCNNFIMKDLCVERILGRLYELEEIFNFLSKKELSKLNIYIDKKFSKISYYINEIYKEEKKKNNNKKSNKNNIEIIDKNKDANILNK